MKTITVPVELSKLTPGRWVQPVLVDWFPRLTEDQILANALADLDGESRPFPDPNLIDVYLEVKP